ncbi:MAG TPA: SWIM zinc finger family protein [Bacillota bacterium]|nr:SWIM zinc finger family protein [Peptococcaceae bacterium MAG4]NLW37559.1 hypothetical protein [Peptococcaceae bacterium]HPU36235.1 SWIM zinc finger family protein [Bacillota bacterium]HPZ42612.1 SWIM zinc finger family protein [Bacillota bacterium]HQD76931.1 SWIM zinc finger family protein [Bacillota bacterium]
MSQDMHRDFIPHEKIEAMAAEAARCLDPELLERGKQYCRDGRVEYTRVFGPMIYAQVNDGKKYIVQLQIDNFSRSTCTCARKQLCEHIAAVFFYHYNDGPQLDNVSSGVDVPILDLRHPPEPIVQPRKPFPVIPTPDGPVERWFKYYELQYRRLREDKCASIRSFSYSYLGYQPDELYFSPRFYDEFTACLSLQSEHWPLPVKDLFRLYGCLFFMAGLEEEVKEQSQKSSFMDSFQISVIEEEFLNAFSSSIITAWRQAQYQPFLQKLVEIVHLRFFQKQEQLFDWLWIYRLLCMDVFSDQEWWEKEKAYLEEKMEKAEEGGWEYYATALALASLYITGNRKEAALTVLQKPRKKRVVDMLFYLEYMVREEEWDALLVWLRWMAPAVRNASPGVIEKVCHYCIRGAENSEAPEQFIKLIRFWLPYGFDVYADYLLEAGLHREWVELHMSYLGRKETGIDRGALRYLESLDPAVLIPLYHQWAARLIEEKSRKSYKEAVRLLKKLRHIYRKQKRKEEWDTFISHLASYYRRLRAFQEELRKGKLIS